MLRSYIHILKGISIHSMHTAVNIQHPEQLHTEREGERPSERVRVTHKKYSTYKYTDVYIHVAAYAKRIIYNWRQTYKYMYKYCEHPEETE